METSLHRFDYKEHEDATASFKEELGKRAFRVVYKGTLSSGFDVTVKKLHVVGPEMVKEFENEASSSVNGILRRLSKLHAPLRVLE